MLVKSLRFFVGFGFGFGVVAAAQTCRLNRPLAKKLPDRLERALHP